MHRFDGPDSSPFMLIDVQPLDLVAAGEVTGTDFPHAGLNLPEPLSFLPDFLLPQACSSSGESKEYSASYSAPHCCSECVIITHFTAKFLKIKDNSRV